MKALAWLLLCWVPFWALADEEPARLAWRHAGNYELIRLNTTQGIARDSLPSDVRTPLGSIWKMFVYAWLADTGSQEPPYTCRGQAKEEVYCCTAGASIERDQALVHSCGLYFDAQRLQLSAATWRSYWQARQAPEWLQDLAKLQPQTEVPVKELLDVLATLPAQAQMRRLLLDVVLDASDGQVVGALGARLRVKTWSWLGAHDAQSRQGGFAGWLADGTPLWMGGVGTSQMVLRHYAGALNDVLPNDTPQDGGGCVQVNLFARYPLRSVTQADGRPAAVGALQGHFQVTFENTNQLDIDSAGELFLLRSATGLNLVAHLDREEYVARVLQREAKSEPVEAAKALAIAIRTYLLQNAGRDGACMTIDDSSGSQRVAPRPATAQARSVVAWTGDMVLAGSTVTYHSDQPGPDRLAWQQAVEQAEAGQRYDAILVHAYPKASLSRWDNPVAACTPLPEAQRWLQAQRSRWRPQLEREAGYSEVQNFAVCRVGFGRPYVDRERQRIYVRGVLSLQDRLDLTHEYLHLAFEAHPNGQDENYVEGLARHLLLE